MIVLQPIRITALLSHYGRGLGTAACATIFHSPFIFSITMR